MKTAFSSEQLGDPGIARADGVIRSCVRHGFCPQTCPTYVLNGDENDSPRGRIDLMRAMLERGGAPDALTVRHVDRCLSCLGCETTCAARVRYRDLADLARTHIERHYRRPWPERVLRGLIAGVLPRPRRLRAALALARYTRFAHRLLPGPLRECVAFVPDAAPATSALRTGVHAAEGTRRMRVALLAGCIQQAMGTSINAAAIRLLTRHGCEVVVTGADGCCGALTLHMGRDEDARDRAGRMIDVWTDELAGAGLDAIVVTASGCGTTVKDYETLFADDDARRDRAQAVAAIARDVTEVLSELGIRAQADFPAVPVAYHDACSLQHGQRLSGPPRTLLRAAGFAVSEVPEKHFCCGSAGTYNLLQPELAGQLGRRKAAALDAVASASGATAVVAGNLGCLVQIGRYTGLPTVHTVELLDWATGGPRPAALDGIDVGRWPAAPAPAPAAPPAGEEDVNFWTYAP